MLVLPMRRDIVVTAKQIATLDHFGKGRLELGVGIGAYREEFKALQPDAKVDRGDIVEEGVQALQPAVQGARRDVRRQVLQIQGRRALSQAVPEAAADLCRRQQRQQHRAARCSGPTAGCRPACMSTRLRAGVKSCARRPRRRAATRGPSRSARNTSCISAETSEQAVARFRKSQMNKHLVSLKKSTLKGQGAATHEDINLIGTPSRR